MEQRENSQRIFRLSQGWKPCSRTAGRRQSCYSLAAFSIFSGGHRSLDAFFGKRPQGIGFLKKLLVIEIKTTVIGLSVLVIFNRDLGSLYCADPRHMTRTFRWRNPISDNATHTTTVPAIRSRHNESPRWR